MMNILRKLIKGKGIMKKTVILAIIGVVIALFVVDIGNPQYGFFAKVDAGYVGIVEHFGKIKDQTLQPGFHVTGYFDHVRPVDVRIQKYEYVMEAFSSDIQQVNLRTVINLNVSPEFAPKLYTTVGMNYQSAIVEPRLLENAKIVVSKYTAEDLVSNREILSNEVLEKMKRDLEQYGIVVTSVSIANIDFTDSFEAAVEAKQVATQNKQRAKTEQEQQTIEAQQQAERKKIAAQAEAEVKKVDADAEAYAAKIKAEAQAEANKKISESLTPELIEYNKIQRWNGQLPVFQGTATPIVDLRDSLSVENE
jgi:regulator of protease activity HflC (stomatin/prohibitin superfamily)